MINHYQQPYNMGSPGNQFPTTRPMLQQDNSNVGSWYSKPQFSNQMQQATPSYLRGRVIDDMNEITVGDVPDDGSTGIFPQKDGHCIITKYWDNSGRIQTGRYILEEDNELGETQEQRTVLLDQIKQIQEKLDLLDSRLIKIDSKPNQNYNHGNRSPKQNRQTDNGRSLDQNESKQSNS